jgi:hypothetical protein
VGTAGGAEAFELAKVQKIAAVVQTAQRNLQVLYQQMVELQKHIATMPQGLEREQAIQLFQQRKQEYEKMKGDEQKLLVMQQRIQSAAAAAMTGPLAGVEASRSMSSFANPSSSAAMSPSPAPAPAPATPAPPSPTIASSPAPQPHVQQRRPPAKQANKRPPASSAVSTPAPPHTPAPAHAEAAAAPPQPQPQSQAHPKASPAASTPVPSSAGTPLQPEKTKRPPARKSTTPTATGAGAVGAQEAATQQAASTKPAVNPDAAHREQIKKRTHEALARDVRTVHNPPCKRHVARDEMLAVLRAYAVVHTGDPGEAEAELAASDAKFREAAALLLHRCALAERRHVQQMQAEARRKVPRAERNALLRKYLDDAREEDEEARRTGMHRAEARRGRAGGVLVRGLMRSPTCTRRRRRRACGGRSVGA